MNEIKIWHNPRCSKSREALKILDAQEVENEVYKYLDTPANTKEIRELLSMLGLSPRELMRTKEAIYKELALQNVQDDGQLIEAMVKHPKLIERPIIIKGDRAIIARPPSLVEEFLKA